MRLPQTVRRRQRVLVHALRTRAAAVRSSGVLGYQDLMTALRTEGMLAPSEIEELASLASLVDPKHAIVEIGSYRGRSTVALALGSIRGQRAPVFAIDPHEPYVGPCGGEFGSADRRFFLRNLVTANVAEHVRVIALPSGAVAAGWRQPIGLLWVDGDHTYEGVQRDIRDYEPHVVSGGTVAFHDTVGQPGPARVVEELLGTARFERVKQVSETAVLRKLS